MQKRFQRFLAFYRGRHISSRIFRFLTWTAIISSSLLAIFVLSVWAGMFGALPSRKELKDIQNPLASEVYSADSVLLGRYYIQERSYLKPGDIPEALKKVLVATEDVRFYQHDGIDYRSLARVLVKSILLQRESAGGGSTITQQLAKNLFPRQRYGVLTMPVNKVREYIIAKRLERNYSKDELLVLYLNTIPFSDNTFGVKTAAERFFSVPVKDLTWSQSAVLVGMLKANHYYNPRLFPDRALKRRNVVLSQAHKYGFLSKAELKKYQASALALKVSETTQKLGIAPYFRAHIQKELLQWCKQNQKPDGTYYDLFMDGLKIYTTIDSRVQRHAEEAMKMQMTSLQKKFQSQLGKRQLQRITDAKVRSLPVYLRMSEQGFSHEQIMDVLKKPRAMQIFTWQGEKDVVMSSYDSLKHHLQFLQTGILAIDPVRGEVLAWVGGINFKYFKYDHVRESTKRQVGSTFKPIVYAAALESGIGPCSYISGQKTIYTNMDDWTPENTDDKTYDRKYSMQGALAGSVNTVSVKLIEKTGIRNTIHIAKKMGIHSDLPYLPSIALGTPSISVKEMVTAYGVMVNNGMYQESVYLKGITDRNGKVLANFERTDRPKRALSEETSQMMIHMLRSVVSEGTGASLSSIYGVRNDIAGKTGTTQSNVDGWFIAMAPSLVIGAWVGADDPRLHFKTTSLGQGSATALPIVARFFQYANKDASLRQRMNQSFAPLDDDLADDMDCAAVKSDANFIQKLFGIKKKPKSKKFKGARKSGGIFARNRKKD